MTNKPTYKELGQRVRKLTDELLDRDQMEKDVERIFNFSIDMIGSGNLKGYFTRINSSFKKTLGYTQREFLKNPFIKFVHDDDVEKTKKALADAVKGKKEIYIVNRYKCKDDSYKWIEWKVSVIVKENKFIAVGRDITDGKQAQEALLKSEEKYRRLFESLVDVFYQADSSGKITMVSPSITKAAGYKPEEVIGSYLKDYYVNPDERNKFSELISTNGFVENFEVQMKKKDGSVLWASVNASLSMDQEGSVVGVEGIARDITERIKDEEVLRVSKERFRSLTEVTSDWIWEVDKNGFYTYSSPKLFDILGYNTEEIIGKTPFDFMPPPEADRLFKIFNDIRASQKSFDCLENINLHKNGHSVILETSGVPIFDTNGKFTGYRGIDRDITQRKRVQEELQKAHDELENRVEERTKELEIEKSNLNEANIALQVLLDKRHEDKKEMEENVLTNAKEMMIPYFEKIRKTKLNVHQKTILSILESYLNEIVSPFTRKTSRAYLNLTPSEIEVANLIRHGRTSKEIADIMSLSLRTIYNHRKSIRKKLEIEDKKTNLRSYLLSFR
jgi:two-component system, NtrC family, sensor kinase